LKRKKELRAVKHSREKILIPLVCWKRWELLWWGLIRVGTTFNSCSLISEGVDRKVFVGVSKRKRALREDVEAT